jgi:thiamine phosphate synthase YjbQ (UPF0047 family)
MWNFVCKTTSIEYQTHERLEFIVITPEIQDFVKNSWVINGTLVIQSHHTTCSLWVNESEKNLIGPESLLWYTHDLKRILDRFADPSENYWHNDIADINNPDWKRNTHLCTPDSCGVINECINGQAHAQGMILPCSLSLIIQDGELLKWRWQEILFIELDHDRVRKLTCVAQWEGK